MTRTLKNSNNFVIYSAT